MSRPPTVVFRDDHSASDGQHSSPGKHLQNGSAVSSWLRWCTGGIGFCSNAETAVATWADSRVARKENRRMLNILVLGLARTWGTHNKCMRPQLDVGQCCILPIVPPAGKVDHVNAWLSLAVRRLECRRFCWSAIGEKDLSGSTQASHSSKWDQGLQAIDFLGICNVYSTI